MEDKILGFGYQDDQDESLKSKDFSYGVFGLNQRVLMTKCDYNPNGGANGTESDCLDISFKVGEGEVNQRWFPITRVFYKGEELTDTTSSEYIAAYNEQMKHFKAVMTHYLKAFNTEETIKGAFKTPPSNFVEYFKLVSRLMSQGIANKILLDLFLQYQWNIGENATQTYLEIPKNLKDGAFLTPHMKPVGEWKEEHNWIEKDEKGFSISMEGFIYFDDAGNVHRFKRNKNFMESNKAKKQTRTPVNMSTDSSAKAATW